MLASFFIMSSIAVRAILITNLIAYEVLRHVWVLLPKLTMAPRLRVLFVALPVFVTHIINIWIYAVIYFLLENFATFGALTGNISKAELTYESFIERLYFSASTYASLGLGDIVPTSDLRMITSAEVLNGLVMIGWTISFIYLTMEKIWSLHSRSSKHLFTAALTKQAISQRPQAQ